jgi:hypothetical protein
MLSTAFDLFTPFGVTSFSTITLALFSSVRGLIVTSNSFSTHAAVLLIRSLYDETRQARFAYQPSRRTPRS